MTLYDLTQAIARFRRLLLIGLGVLVILVLFVALDWTDDGIQWRGGEKFQTEFQITVVAPGTSTLSQPEANDNLQNAAVAYGDLLGSLEAAQAISDVVGYQLTETLDITVQENAPVISATLIGPTVEQATAAVDAAFAWLVETIDEPLDAQPPVTIVTPIVEVSLVEPFDTTVTLEIDEGLSAVDDAVLLIARSSFDKEVVVPVAARSGSAVSGAATLERSGSLLLVLEGADGTEYDQFRVVPDALPAKSDAYPVLEVRLDSRAIGSDIVINEDPQEGEEAEMTVWLFDARGISSEWLPGIPPTVEETSTVEVFQVANVTQNPTAEQIGGRRGPLLAVALLMVGIIALLSLVIVLETWRRERDKRVTQKVRLAPDAQTSIDVSVVSAPDAFDPEQLDQ